MRKAFSSTMTFRERLLGVLYIPFHSVILPFLLLVVFLAIGVEFSSAYFNLLYYTISFALILVIMFRFLKDSFSDMCGKFGRTLSSVVLGYLLHMAITFAAVLLLNQLLPVPVMTEVSPNTEAVAAAAVGSFNMIFAMTVILAPIVEEIIFRGALFGSLRMKSRFLAYAVTIVVFALYHLWQFLIDDFSWITLLFALRYVPASIALGWVYERTGNIWTPILLHSVINLVGMLLIRAQ
ncbi:MAG: CPBP family intramembrane metalloprotease [Oscillospiraceae bacterium]|nr:CPBP family intramembrane metalloprotease [Oscillospiraceae bacterium]